jgi:hypothetical protein
MMEGAVKIEGGFAEVGAGAWLMGRGQPAAFLGSAVRRRRKGLFLRDRSALDLVETTAAAKCADARRPFLTHIPCAAKISAVSSKVLVAPAAAWAGAETVKIVPMSMRNALCVTMFDGEWVVMATASRTARFPVEDGDTLSARPDSVVAWTGNRPTGFCPKLGLLDVILPRGARDLLLHFHGPTVVWVEGTCAEGKASKVMRRVYGA